ncbi:MAG: type II secretion system protein [Agathobacter sp.]|nr:type II secretion system protein [Agathobacter sp.]
MNKQQNKLRMNNKGFSLVELIVVIAIMAVLIGVLAPQFIKYVDKSRASTDMQNLQQIKSAAEAYFADNPSAEAEAFKVKANGTELEFDGAADEVMANAGLSQDLKLSSTKWEKVEMVYNASTNAWSITGTNTVDKAKYNLASMATATPAN